MKTRIAWILAILSAVAGFASGARADRPATTTRQDIHIYLHVDRPGKVEVLTQTKPVEPPAAPATRTAPAAKPAAAEAPAPAPEKSAGTLGLLMFVFVLAVFLGFELISRVPSQLHTPLMSGSNAISGITIVGALIAAGMGSDEGGIPVLLGSLAVAFAMINVVGGYLVTDRMLGMFQSKNPRLHGGQE